MQDEIIPELVNQSIDDVSHFNPGFKSLQKSIFLANALVSLDKFDTSLSILNKASNLAVEPEHQKKKWQYINNIHWNLANKFLHVGEFEKGWGLYDAGLLVKAEGKQKYQRSLLKPFNHSEVALWDGQDLANKKILVLAEQGIGDTMMFTVLIKSFLRTRSSHIYFVPGDRLVRLYREAFSSEPNITIVSSRDSIKIDPNCLDFMIPIGSIMKYFWNTQQQPYLQEPLLSLILLFSHNFARNINLT